jgi:hypothetical protein
MAARGASRAEVAVYPSMRAAIASDAPVAMQSDHSCVLSPWDCPRPNGHTCDDPTSPELHILNTWTPSGDGTRRGAINVYVQRTRPVVLFLSSDAAARWTITVDVATAIRRIVVVGSPGPIVNAPAGIPIEFRGSPNVGPAGDITVDPAVIQEIAERSTGLVTTSYHGCFQSTGFAISDLETLDLCQPSFAQRDVVETSACADRPFVPTSCANVPRESAECLTMSIDKQALVRIGLDTGRGCIAAPTVDDGTMGTSFARIGADLFYCNTGVTLRRQPLDGGSTEDIPMGCLSVAASQEGELVVAVTTADFDNLVADELRVYRDLAAIRADAPDRTWAVAPTGNETAATAIVNRTVFLAGTGHSATTVNLDTGACGEVDFTDYEDDIMGIGSPSRDTLAVLARADDRRIVLFDAGSGAQLRSVVLDQGAGWGFLHGLDCTSSGPTGVTPYSRIIQPR